MAREPEYRQYELTRPGKTPDAVIRLVTWLPEQKGKDLIKRGTQLTIKNHRDDKGEFENQVWTVNRVSKESLPAKSVIDRSHTWTKYRSHTDV